jgi:two-component system, LytTR family, sensor kinase
MEFKFQYFIILILSSTLMLVAGLYLLANFKSLFKRYIKNELLRQNLVVWLVSICFTLAITPTSPEFYGSAISGKILRYYLIQITAVTGMVLFVFNITWYVSQLNRVKNAPFRKKMVIIMCAIITCTVLIGIPVNYLANNGNFIKLEYTLAFNFYTGCITALVYVTMSHVDLERQKKLNEKELEVARLQGLKTKAELDALHSKINPHFLYNALNSIADLSLTDGKKARQMSIALADLFRYSINYSKSNYSAVKEELEMVRTYLEIEKIRFEDRLTYEITIEEDLSYYLLPRFILQPVVENAVKHGLKSTGKSTSLKIIVKSDEGKLSIRVYDDGPTFPTELLPGYGLKSVFDKMDLLFKDAYEVNMVNEPEKYFEIAIKKLIKNEPEI